MQKKVEKHKKQKLFFRKEGKLWQKKRFLTSLHILQFVF